MKLLRSFHHLPCLFFLTQYSSFLPFPRLSPIPVLTPVPLYCIFPSFPVITTVQTHDEATVAWQVKWHQLCHHSTCPCLTPNAKAKHCHLAGNTQTRLCTSTAVMQQLDHKPNPGYCVADTIVCNVEVSSLKALTRVATTSIITKLTNFPQPWCSLS